jgi:hypothetical protein
MEQRFQIYGNGSSKKPSRVCDFLIDGDKYFLEMKKANGRLIRIPLEELLHQINVASNLEEKSETEIRVI